MTNWWWALLVAAGAIAIGQEWFAREGPRGLLVAALFVMPAALAIQLCLLYGYRNAPSLLLAWSTFGLTTAALRFGLVLYLGDPLTGLKVLGFLAIVAGAAMMRLG